MREMKQWGSLVVSMVLLALISGTAWAHKASDSFIYLNQDRGEIRIDVALRDLAVALPLDRNGDRQLSGAELRAGRDQITRWVEQGVTLSSTQADCRLTGQQWGLSRHSDGPYAAGLYTISCPDGAAPDTLTYNLLFSQDPLHRGLISLESDGTSTLGVVGPDSRQLALSAGDAPGSLQLFGTFLYEGVIHLLIGLDHILFLLVLMLPATLRKNDGSPPVGLKQRLWELTGIVTAFTAAHSVTLALAALGVVRLPIAWVETIIALSIAVAAMNVMWPILGRKTWKLAFGFGLIHGFGFASVLGDLTSGVSQTVLALAGFNIGVELGQLGLLVIAFPLLYLWGKTHLYGRAVVPLTLIAVGAISLYWVAERAMAI
ncbi:MULTISPECIES: HupE/UreJ family protein [Marinobacter]|jgi:HupE/UreJ protein|uniref:HupE/UreJ family protein n=2 Tax=Marinobacteraceae TaxID=2887365 RepID=UPI0029426726|nr:HupE/UreJ family protein [Marinobacter salarius]WOI19866.1 HupE/UreJ family protein [Marinobacter salarius]